VLDLAAVAVRGGGGGSTLPFGDASFDMVVSHHGLQLLPDRGRALAEVRRCSPRRAAVGPWVDPAGLRVVTEANTGVASR
jgi:SAM-dependent methyltransferase